MSKADPEDRAPVRHYTSVETAEMLGCSTKWLHAYLRDRPWYRLVGAKKLFSAADISRISESMIARPSAARLRDQRDARRIDKLLKRSSWWQAPRSGIRQTVNLKMYSARRAPHALCSTMLTVRRLR